MSQPNICPKCGVTIPPEYCHTCEPYLEKHIRREARAQAYEEAAKLVESLADSRSTEAQFGAIANKLRSESKRIRESK